MGGCNKGQGDIACISQSPIRAMFGTTVLGEMEIVWSRRWYHSNLKERWWVSIGSPVHCDHCAISNHSAAICRRMSPNVKSTGTADRRQISCELKSSAATPKGKTSETNCQLRVRMREDCSMRLGGGYENRRAAISNR